MQASSSLDQAGAVPLPEVHGADAHVIAALEDVFAPVLGSSVFHKPAPPPAPPPPPPGPEPEPPASKGKPAPPAKGKPAGKKPATPEVKAKPESKTKKGSAVEPPPEPESSPPPPPPDEYDVRIEGIRAQYSSEISSRQELAAYLQQQQAQASTAHQQELDANDKLYTHFWRYAGLPPKPSHLTFDGTKTSADHLLNPKAIMGAVQQVHSKEVLQPTQVFEFSDATAAPHYLQQTAANINRATMRAGLLQQAREAPLSSKSRTWRTLSPEQVKELIDVSHQRQKLSKRTMPGVLPVEPPSTPSDALYTFVGERSMWQASAWL